MKPFRQLISELSVNTMKSYIDKAKTNRNKHILDAERESDRADNSKSKSIDAEHQMFKARNTKDDDKYEKSMATRDKHVDDAVRHRKNSKVSFSKVNKRSQGIFKAKQKIARNG